MLHWGFQLQSGTTTFLENLPNRQIAMCSNQFVKSLLLAIAFAMLLQRMQQPWSIVYYYTPLPLNLANNNKQASKQALLLSVLAITLFHRFGLYSTPATSYPRWCPCQIQVLS